MKEWKKSTRFGKADKEVSQQLRWDEELYNHYINTR